MSWLARVRCSPRGKLQRRLRLQNGSLRSHSDSEKGLSDSKKAFPGSFHARVQDGVELLGTASLNGGGRLGHFPMV